MASTNGAAVKHYHDTSCYPYHGKHDQYQKWQHVNEISFPFVFISGFALAANLITDLCYGLLDPRVTLGDKR